MIKLNKEEIDKLHINKKLSKIFPKELAKKYICLVVDIKEGQLEVIMDEVNPMALDFIKMYYNMDPIIYLGERSQILNKIDNIYFKTENSNLFEEDLEINDSYIVNYLNDVISDAVFLKATDIHLESLSKNCQIRFRINGQLKHIKNYSKENHKFLVARLKVLSNLDITETRIPQDGRFKINISNQSIDIRISTYPSIMGEKVVLRLLNKSNFSFKLEDLGLNDKSYKQLNKLISQPNGLILFTGPAGSGKTTSLYTILNELNSEKLNILTIEDPIEYTFDGITQSQVNTDINYDFSRALKSILRQDPNIIMIGEIRDIEVAQIATRAAITGHLVLSTLHTIDGFSTIIRLLSMGIDLNLILSGLSGIVSQRLVRILCDECKEAYYLSKKEQLALNLDLSKNYRVYRAAGCSKCIDGYRERVPLIEILSLDQEVYTRLQNVDVENIYKYREAFLPDPSIREELLSLLLGGETSMEEVFRTISTL